MARRRRRRTGHGNEGTTSSDTDDVTPLSSATGEADKRDRSCFSHPSFDLDLVCDDCGGSICQMCSISLHSLMVCTECFEVRIRRRRRGSSWHGWVALACALFALGAVGAPFSVAADPSVAELFPGGRAFFVYGSMITSSAGVLLGFLAQDFDGLSRRAGIVAVAMSVLALCAIVTMNLLAILVTSH